MREGTVRRAAQEPLRTGTKTTLCDAVRQALAQYLDRRDRRDPPIAAG